MSKLQRGLIYNGARVATKIIVAASLPIVLPTTFIVTVTVGTTLVFSVGCGAIGIVCCNKLVSLYHQQLRFLSNSHDVPISGATVWVQNEGSREIMVMELPQGSQVLKGSMEADKCILLTRASTNVEGRNGISNETRSSLGDKSYSLESARELRIGKQKLSTHEEEKTIRESLAIIKKILGDGSPPRRSIVEEIEALCLLTGLEPPFMGDGTPNIDKVREELSLLRVVIGVK